MNIPRTPKFWTLEKEFWFKVQKEIDPKDLSGKKALAEKFNKFFDCEKSSEVIYVRYRKARRKSRNFSYKAPQKCTFHKGSIAGSKLSRP